MDKQTFLTTMSSSKRVQEVNKLLQDHDLRSICDLLEIPSSSFSKIMWEGDYIYHKADKKYYPFVRSEEERLTKDLSKNNDEATFFKQHEDTLRKVIQHFENKWLLILDDRIYSRDATYSNKSIRMNNAIYEEFSSFCEEYYPHLKIQHIIAQALIDAKNKYRPESKQ